MSVRKQSTSFESSCCLSHLALLCPSVQSARSGDLEATNQQQQLPPGEVGEPLAGGGASALLLEQPLVKAAPTDEAQQRLLAPPLQQQKR